MAVQAAKNKEDLMALPIYATDMQRVLAELFCIMDCEAADVLLLCACNSAKLKHSCEQEHTSLYSTPNC